jgi:hypothetical protein
MHRPSTPLISRLIWLSFLAVFACAAPAAADQWIFNASLGDGGTASGSFVYDMATDKVTSWDFGVHAPALPAQVSDHLFMNGTFASSELNHFATYDYLGFYDAVFTGAPSPDTFIFALFITANGLAAGAPMSVLPTPSDGGYYEAQYHWLTVTLIPPSMEWHTSPLYGVNLSGGELAPVPLPPSAFLLGSGLLGLAGWRRFRKS